MKKIILLFVVCYLFSVDIAYAVSPTQTPDKTSAEIQVDKLKDRIASRVAELKLVERRGIIGHATAISNTQLTITDTQNNTRFIDVDEITKFSSPSAKTSFGISDITKGDQVGILGLYNKQSRRLLARFVDMLILPKIIHGAVLSTNSDDFTITIVTEKKEQIVADVQTTTKTSTYTKGADLVRSGFSKIKEGERIMVVGFPDKKEKNRITASRIIVFPDVPKNPKITLSAAPKPTSTPQIATPTATASAKKKTQ